MTEFLVCSNRRDSDSKKWQKYANQDILPLWIADSDFCVAEPIQRALAHRVAHGVFGYGGESVKLKQKFIEHAKRLYDWEIDPDWVLIIPGVVPGLNYARACSVARGKRHGVTVKPVYPYLFNQPAILDYAHSSVLAENLDNRWRIDFEGLAQQVRKETGLLLLCHPHNPLGRVYEREELLAYLRIAEQHDLIVCSDEIHCDLLLGHRRHLPFACLNEEAANRSITLMAASKTFNIAGLCCALAIIPNPALRMAFQQQCVGLSDVNILGVTASAAAYGECESWRLAQNAYLSENAAILYEAVNKIEGLSMTEVEATYLAWIEAKALNQADLLSFFERHGLGLSDGKDFGLPGYVRLNFACERALLLEAIERLAYAAKQA